jgi:hypothetical protein
MPSDSAYWLISAPHRRGDDQDLFRSVKSIVGDNVAVGGLEIPDLKVSLTDLGRANADIKYRLDRDPFIAAQPVRCHAEI